MKHRKDERGTTLLLFPAGVLVVMLLAAIAVDLSVLHLAQREAYRAASQAAEDAAAMIDLGRYRTDGTIVLDETRAQNTASASIAAATVPGQLAAAPTVNVQTVDGIVTVTVAYDVERVFGRAIPGSDGVERITVTATGQLEQQP